MSAVPNVRGVLQVEVPKDVEAVMTTFATAKPGTQEAKEASNTLTKLFQAIHKSNLPAYPTGTELRDAKDLLIKLRTDTASRSSVEKTEVQGILAKANQAVQARVMSVVGTILSITGRADPKATFTTWTRQLDNKLTKVTTLEQTLAKQSEAVKATQLTVKLPERAALSVEEIKAQMPAAADLISINCKRRDSLYGMFETLFEGLAIPQDKAVLEPRAKTFGPVDCLVPNLKGADITVLQNVDVKRFDEMAEALKARCDKFKVIETGLAFFVPTETKEVRMISITAKADKTATIRLESTFTLAREEGQEAIAQVTATYTVDVAADGTTKTTCIFNSIQPLAGLVKLSDLQKLRDIFPDTAKINAPSAASTAN